MRHTESHLDHEDGFSDAAISEYRDDGASSGASTPRGDTPATALGVFSRLENSPSKQSRDSGDEGERKSSISKILSSKAEAWMGKKGLWPWKGNERDGIDPKASRFVWPSLQNDQENELEHQKSESQVFEINRTSNNEATESYSSYVSVNSSSSASSGGSTSSSTVNKLDVDTDSLDYEILWEDMTIGEQIGQG